MFELLLGHLVGDYLLQNNWMALNKHKNDIQGWLTCTVHCVLYTISVCLIMQVWTVEWIAIVFISHFVIDKFGLTDKYLKLIRGRSVSVFVEDTKKIYLDSFLAIKAGFTCFVYAVVDNTIHILILYGAFKML